MDRCPRRLLAAPAQFLMHYARAGNDGLRMSSRFALFDVIRLADIWTQRRVGNVENMDVDLRTLYSMNRYRYIQMWRIFSLPTRDNVHTAVLVRWYKIERLHLFQ